MQCLFCDIGSKRIAAEVIYEDEAAMAFLDINPRAPGHAMVIPKAHAETIIDLPDNDMGPLFSAVKRTAEKLMHATKSDGLTIGINQGRASGQEIDHLHVHLIPRFADDRGNSLQSVVNNHPKKSTKEIAEQIRSHT